MKRRTIQLWILSVLILLGLILILRSYHIEDAQTSLSSHQTESKSKEPDLKTPTTSYPIQTNSPANLATNYNEAVAVSNRAEAIRMSIQTRNVMINFWGQVVDQDSQPLSGVTLRLRYLRYVHLGGLDSRDEWVSETSISDANGLFALVGAQGGVLSLESAEKTGYESRIYNRSFRYFGSDGFKPDSSRPVVFKMWKIRGAEPLVQESLARKPIPVDGTFVNFDLINARKVSSGGDLRVSLARDPLHIRRGREKFDWVVEFEGIGGGLIESVDEFMYLAPEKGYEKSLKYEMKKDDPAWSGSREWKFYLQSRDGKCFAQLIVRIAADFEPPPSSISIDYSLNPAGSRNLEFDWTKRISPANPQ